MDLIEIVDDELLQPTRGAIVLDDLIATGQLRDSVSLLNESTKTKQVISLMAESYILELRDGEQYKHPPTIEDIEVWIEAKGLQGILDANSVLSTILTEGTTWDKKGGSEALQRILNEENLQRIMNIAIENETNKLLKTKWLLQ